MSFVISDEYLPATLTAKPMNDEEFMEFCNEHPDLSFEMTAEGGLIVMAPTHSLTGLRNANLTHQLTAWAMQDGRGVAGDSSMGFVLPNGARRSPDASWTLRSRVQQLNAASLAGFWHLCPDFAIELKSESDSVRTLNKKLLEYLANGAQLGWLVHPAKRSVTIYRPNAEPETRTDIDSINGEGALATFTLQLGKIWKPLD